MDVSVKGHLVLTTCNGAGMGANDVWKRGEAHFAYEGKPYVPQIYPGRMRWGEIHIWDKHGTVVMSDAVPGMAHLNGIGIDQDDNIYMMTASRRVIAGKNSDPKLENDASCTLVKVPPGKAKVLSSGGNAGGSGRIPVPLAPEDQPKRSVDLAEHSGGVSGWVEGAEWMYGGVGYGAPGAGGNIDDGKPLVLDGGPQNPHSIGGDEVALFYACYVASHTDHRIFIADAGNARILSVKLNYHIEEKIPLGDKH